MKGVLEEGPDEVAEQEARGRLSEGEEGDAGLQQGTERSTRVHIKGRQCTISECKLDGRAEVEVDGNG